MARARICAEALRQWGPHVQCDDEQHRHRCEVRQLLRWRVQHGRDWVREWLAAAARRRDTQQLRSDATEQWARGSRGQHGDWR